MRLLWISNAPWVGSGYGTQTKQVVPRLARAGHEVAIACNYGLTGTVINWDGVPVLPHGLEQYSNDILGDHYRWWMGSQKGWAISLYDAWVYKERMLGEMNMAGWVPVDHDPAPPAVIEWAREHFTIAMSQFGQRKFVEQGVNAHYVPHALDDEYYNATEIMPSAGARTRDILQVPDDAFLVMLNSANTGTIHTSRKAFGEMFTALAAMMDKYPDVYVYIHALKVGPNSHPLPLLAAGIGLDSKRIRWVDQYAFRRGGIEARDMAALYHAADVLLATSKGEGFGLPVLESQAASRPVVVSDFTAQSELVGAGWKVPVQPEWDANHQAFFGIPNIGRIITSLEEARERKGDPELAKAAIEFATEYHADTVFDRYWKPTLAALEEQLQPIERRKGNTNAAKRRNRKKGAAA